MTAIVDITSEAAEQIARILVDHPNKILMLGVNNRGCSGHSYTFDLVDAHQLHALDETVHPSVVVSHTSMLRLIGSTLHWQVNKFGAQFVYTNPAVINTCGCGTSVGFAS